jgi:hypothetical protein
MREYVPILKIDYVVGQVNRTGMLNSFEKDIG